ncbi:MAG TPA: hypothetical protein VFS52_14620 [Steroidobacteraceae bacterium]|jgi:hypothetical protein|nr:hypothetical protein [Steroidobacteraceae bacterium]
MKYVLIAVLALVLGALAARWYYQPKPEAPVDPINVMITQMRTHAVIEHERQVAVWYRACPEVVGKDPEIFIAWPAKLSYELELSDATLERAGDTLRVHARPIHADEPAVPSDFLDYLSTTSLFTFANEQQLVNEEIKKSTPLARYLTTYYLKRDASLRADFAGEIEALVSHMAGALGVPVKHVEVDIASEEITLPKLPKLALCGGSSAAVNGVPFAKNEDEYTVPIRFNVPPSKRSHGATTEQPAVPAGIASIYGQSKKEN